jgi:Lipase maturation factor
VFAALSPRYAEPWLAPLLYQLLSGDRDVLRLLRVKPLPAAPPVNIRVLPYHYRYAIWQAAPAGQRLVGAGPGRRVPGAGHAAGSVRAVTAAAGRGR